MPAPKFEFETLVANKDTVHIRFATAEEGRAFLDAFWKARSDTDRIIFGSRDQAGRLGEMNSANQIDRTFTRSQGR